MKRVRKSCLLLTPFLIALLYFLVPIASDTADQSFIALAPTEALLEGQQELAGVAVADDGTVYISDRAAGIVYRLSPSNVLTTLLSGLDRPAGLALDRNGRLLIAEEKGGNVFRLESDGRLTVLGSGIKTPRWLALSSDGAIYVSAHRLSAPDGADVTEGREIIRIFPDGAVTVVASGIRRLEGVAVMNGYLVAATKGLESDPESPGMLLRYPIQPDGILGTPIQWVDTGLKQPVGVVSDRLKALYFSSRSLTVDTDTAKLAIGKVHQDARLSVFAEHLKDPQGVGFGPDGSLYLADGMSGRLLRFRAPPPPALVFPSFTNQSPLTVQGTTDPQSRIDAFLNDSALPQTFTDGAFALILNLIPNAQNSLVAFSTAQNGQGLTSAPTGITIVHDNIAPVITNLEPLSGSHLNTSTPPIQGSFFDAGSGIDLQKVQITLDGIGANPLAQITASGFTLSPGALNEGSPLQYSIDQVIQPPPRLHSRWM